ncbi:MAG: BBP7 family outer membrane beta-barrel protein [Pirellulales bacterium]|nr:BBP7 family outer membrane beta-barrel protein [Pirellulales bacterium]
MQLFAPPEVSTVGGPPKANEGFFFSYEGLYWATSAPRIVPVGNQNVPTRDAYYGLEDSDLVIQTNTLDTGFLTAKFEPGQRWEIGRIVDHSGWVLSVTQLQDQDIVFSNQNVQMVVDDPPFGPGPERLLDGVVGHIITQNPYTDTPVIRPLPLVWDTLSGNNSTRYWSIEWMYIYRPQPTHHNSYFEFFIGPRYFEFDDSFNVDATGGILSDSMWNTNAENHVIAGQVGARWFHKTGRWMLSTEGRLWAGLNCQNFTEEGVLGTLLPSPSEVHADFTPLLMSPMAFFHTAFKREFNPGVELRVDLRYQLTRAISVRAGWTGMWMDRVARAAGMVDYTLQRSAEGLPAGFGLLTDQNRQNVWINGFTIGLDINR